MGIVFLVKRRKNSNSVKNKEVSNEKQNIEKRTPYQQEQESRKLNTNEELNNSSEVSSKKIEIKFKSKPTKVKNEMKLRESELNISSVELNINEVASTSVSTKESKINETKNQTNTKNDSIVVGSKNLIRLYFIENKNVYDTQKFSKNQVNSNFLENKALKTNKTEILSDKAIDQLNNLQNKVRVLDGKKNPLNESDNLGETKKIDTGNFFN
jgi:hypothetical protein